MPSWTLTNGRAYAQSFPNARFKLIPEAGHVPQIEQPERLLKLVWEFAGQHHGDDPGRRIVRGTVTP